MDSYVECTNMHTYFIPWSKVNLANFWVLLWVNIAKTEDITEQQLISTGYINNCSATHNNQLNRFCSLSVSLYLCDWV